MTFALIYHDIADPGEEDEYGFPGAAAARYKLTPDRFEAHLDAIAEARVAVGLAQDDAQAVLTFDDGGASAMRAAEALERRGWRGHYFITTSRIGSAGFLGVEEVRELAQRGHEVGSHSHSHPTYMGALSRGEIEREWCQSRDALNRDSRRCSGHRGGPRWVCLTRCGGGGRTCGVPAADDLVPHRKSAWHDGLRVDGRYTVWRNTSSKRAAAYARGDRAGTSESLALVGRRRARRRN